MAARKKATNRRRAPRTSRKDTITEETLRDFVRREAARFLADENITSIGVAYKNDYPGSKTPEVERVLCVQFSVRQKVPETKLEAIGTALIPATLDVGGVDVPTDVVERQYHPSYKIVPENEKSSRKTRVAPLVPGVSVGHSLVTAGTLGAIVYDRNGNQCMLSNWHVLHGAKGKVGDSVVQPGAFDDNRVEQNKVGVLLRSHLGIAGDCAIASIEQRGADKKVYGLGVEIGRIGRPGLRDRVVKSGRTTDVTYGVVRRVDVTVKLSYDGQGQVLVGGFEIGPDPARPPKNGEISMGGDSGSPWLAVNPQTGKPDDVMVGLHFAGEGTGDPDEHAVACYAQSVFEKLEISLASPGVVAGHGATEVQATGYSETFLGRRIRVPGLGAHSSDTVLLDGSRVLHYAHFSVAQSKSRRLPRFVAWNIDGRSKRSISRKGLKFKLDTRIDSRFQAGDELYAGNRLDRGHIARRADLVWGSLAEAKKANSDSFFFTNIAPQHEAFNQSERDGLWGQLENAILEEAGVEALRVSVFGGPIFRDDDRTYRGVRIPKDFWKVVMFVDTADEKLKAKGYILTQDDLLNQIEALELDDFRVWQVAISTVAAKTGLQFTDIEPYDSLVVPESIAGSGRAAREVRSPREVV